MASMKVETSLFPSFFYSSEQEWLKSYREAHENGVLRHLQVELGLGTSGADGMELVTNSPSKLSKNCMAIVEIVRGVIQRQLAMFIIEQQFDVTADEYFQVASMVYEGVLLHLLMKQNVNLSLPVWSPPHDQSVRNIINVTVNEMENLLNQCVSKAEDWNPLDE